MNIRNFDLNLLRVFDALMRLQRPGHRGRHMGMMMGGSMGHHGPD